MLTTLLIVAACDKFWAPLLVLCYVMLVSFVKGDPLYKTLNIKLW